MDWIARIGKRVKLHDLHVLMTVVDAGGMGTAARLLHTSQPAISRSVAELELTIGVALLERTARGVSPTPYGRAMLDAATQAFDSLRAGIQHFGAMIDPDVAELRIGGQEAIISGLLPEALSRLREIYPNIAVHVSSVTSVRQQYAELRDRRIDLILGRLRPPFEDDVEAEVLREEPTLVIASSTNPLTKRKRINFSELAGEPWALPQSGTLVSALFAESRTGNIKFDCIAFAA